MPTSNVAARRLQKLTEAIRSEGLDAVVLYGNAWQNDYLRYAADFGILEGEGIAIVRRDGEATLYLDDASEAERAAVECPGLDTVAVVDVVQEADQAIARFGNRKVAGGPRRHLPYGLSRHWQEGMTDATAMLDRLLMLKAEEEVDAIRRAAHLADEGYAVFRNAARVGKADYEVVAEIEAFFRVNGVDDNFMIIGVGGPEVRGMTPPSGKRLGKGDLVTTELTPCVDGYYVQICRTLVVGEPSAAQRKAFGVYHDAMVAGIDAVRPGITAADIAKAENDVFRRHGLGDYVTSEYTRVRGHGLGLFPDSKPHILEDATTPIVENMALIVHPNTYHPEVGYIVLGDSIIVGSRGAEVLTTTPRELFSAGANGGAP
jgi:Xaa-Pro dipeptidase